MGNTAEKNIKKPIEKRTVDMMRFFKLPILKR